MGPTADVSQSAPPRKAMLAPLKKSSSKKERPAEPLAIPKQSASSSSKVARGKSYGHVHASGNSQVHLGDHHHHYHFPAATSMYDFEPGTAVDGDRLQMLLSYASSISDIAHRMMAANSLSGVALDPEILDERGESDGSVHDFTEDEAGLSEDTDEKGRGPFDLEDVGSALPLSRSGAGTEISYESDDPPSPNSSSKQNFVQESGYQSGGGIDEHYLSPPAKALQPRGDQRLDDLEHDTWATGAHFYDIYPDMFSSHVPSILQSLEHTMSADNSHITTWLTHGAVWNHCRSITGVSVDTVLALRIASLLQQFGSGFSSSHNSTYNIDGPQDQFAGWMWDPWTISMPLNRTPRVSKPASSMMLDVHSLRYPQPDPGG